MQARIRRQVRAEAALAAVGLFIERGFEATTVDDVCAEIGMARRTFFRYFPTKEDAVLSMLGNLAQDGCDSFVARPVDDDVWTALRRSMDPAIRRIDADPDGARALLALINDHDGLRAAYLARFDAWRRSLAVVVAERRGRSAPDLSCDVLASTALGAFSAACDRWVDAPAGVPVESFVDDAFACVRPA